MKPHEAKARETREWLDKAAEDLAMARVLIDTNHSAGALFFCQQTAEKSLKAFLTWHDRTFKRTHDVKELGVDCQAIDGTLAVLLKDAAVLSEYAWKLRYPGTAYIPEREETEAMFDIAYRVFGEVQSRLPLETRHSEDQGDNL